MRLAIGFCVGMMSVSAYAILPLPKLIQVPNQISSCGTKITRPGVYNVTADLRCVGKTGITIFNTRGVTLNLNGHALQGLPLGPQPAVNGIWINNSSAVIINAQHSRILGFQIDIQLNSSHGSEIKGDPLYLTNAGRGLDIDECTGVTVTGLHVSDVTANPVLVGSSTNTHLNRFTVQSTAQTGIYLTQSQSTWIENAVLSGATIADIFVLHSPNTTVHGAQITSSREGLQATESNNLLLNSVEIHSTQDGVLLGPNDNQGVVIQNSTVTAPTTGGVHRAICVNGQTSPISIVNSGGIVAQHCN